MRYAGGKGGCFHQIINLMPPHDVYIETHLGGGNVLERKAPAVSTLGIDVDAAVIDKWKDRPEYQTSDYTFICGDAGSLISERKMTGRELIYSDPPYLMETRKTGRLYKHEMTDDQHEEWLRVLKDINCHVIISDYKSDMYMDYLPDWFYKEFTTMTRGGIATESVWCNFTIKKRHTNGQAVPIKSNTGKPRALPSCLSPSLSGAAPRAPLAPSRQGIKHPIIEAHYGV